MKETYISTCEKNFVNKAILTDTVIQYIILFPFLLDVGVIYFYSIEFP